MIRPKIDALFAKAAPDSVMTTGKARAAFGAMRFMPLVSLVWLGWVFGPAVFNIGPSFRHWLWPTLASIPVFLILYCLAYTCPRRHNLRYAIAIALLGAALTPLNPFAETYLIYACAVVACGQSWRQSIWVMLAMLAVYTVEWFAIGFPWPYLVNALLIGSIVGIMGIYQNVVHQRQAELRMSHEEVRRLAASAERERIGRDLHDLLGHTLSLVALKSELARRLVERDPRAAGREIADVERIAREALAQVRSAVSGIRSAALASELASAHLLLEAAGVQMGYANDAGDLPPDIETCLALVLREAVTNIERHAHAHAVNVTVTQAEGKVHLQIRDDGHGGVSARGNGLNGMRERVQALDGSLTIDSPRGAGTTVDVGLPVPLAAKPVARIEAARTPAPVVAALPHAGGTA